MQQIIIPPMQPPLVGNPVNIHNVITCRKSLAKRQKISPANVTNEELVNSIILEKQTIERYAGDQLAPPWFAQAMAVQLNPIYQNLEQLNLQVTALNLQTTALNLQVTRLFNRNVRHPMDVVTPVAGVAVDYFPHTFEALRSLNNHRCNHLINRYNIEGNFENILERKIAISDYLGVKYDNIN
mmetsp:Transcript_23340/g.21228  ORF Transcript_23340/g.21228 Transcript_23340/m.21228 type:complete len:183 (+) Transcript_23340:83-631(+)